LLFNSETFDFDKDFNRLLDNAETKSMQQKKLKNTGKLVAGMSHKSLSSASLQSTTQQQDTDSDPAKTSTGNGGAGNGGASGSDCEGGSDDGQDEIAAARARFESTCACSFLE
jgi:hypothetical protein